MNESDWTLPISGVTYIDNGDGTCRVEYPKAGWFNPTRTAWPAPETPRLPWRTRLAWRWYAVREWIAVHVLRVSVGEW